MTVMSDNIDWLYRQDIFYCEFCEAEHDATNHIGDTKVCPACGHDHDPGMGDC